MSAVYLGWEVCTEGVTRKGMYEPCDRLAVALRLDPESGEPYPVCAGHVRATMLSLEDAVARANALRNPDAAE